jgi:hypothetical protein
MKHSNRITAVNDFVVNNLEFFSDEEVFERILRADTDDLRVLYEIVFDAKEV